MNIFKDIEFLKYPTKLLLRKYDYMSIILLWAWSQVTQLRTQLYVHYNICVLSEQ